MTPRKQKNLRQRAAAGPLPVTHPHAAGIDIHAAVRGAVQKYRLLNALFLRRAMRRRSLAIMNGIKRVAEGEADLDA
jgi:hypothetical protein